MARVDDRILEYTLDRGFSGSRLISESPHIDVSQAYISSRLRVLLGFNLIRETVGNGIYKLTHEGRLYLAGAYDVKTGEYVDGVDPDEWECDNWTEVWELTHYVAELEKRRLEHVEH